MLEENLKEVAKRVRLDVLDAITKTKSSHIGSCFSIVEILTVLYFKVLNINPKSPADPIRDIFILSKGHAAVALYAVLAEAGFFNKAELNRYAENGTKLAGHIIKGSLPGIEVSSGSLGHGLSIISGMAWAAKKEASSRKFYCLLGDGECDEGSIWEAVMFAAQNRLTNLTAIVDYNHQQGMGHTEDVINQDNLAERFKAFGWNVQEINGHNFKELLKAFESNGNSSPKVVIAKTIKGKGVSFMEDEVEWHYRSPSPEQLEMAVKEINN